LTIVRSPTAATFLVSAVAIQVDPPTGGRDGKGDFGLTSPAAHRQKSVGHWRRIFALTLFAGLMLAALAFANSGRAAIETPPPPSVWSDKADYAPGETVTLSGANWAAGESVHIRVNDDAGQTWSRDVDVTAAADGTISDQFNLPNWFVAQYTVTASGASGTATWTFTDGNVTLHLTTAQAGATTSISVAYQVFGSAGGGGTVDNTCSTSATSSGTLVLNANGTVNIPGFGNNNLSVRLGAVTSTPAGKTIDFWAVGDKNTEAAPQVSVGATPCISANQNAGTNGNVGDLYAHLKSVNSAPVCNNGTATTNEDVSVATTLSCTDADSNPLTYTILSGPSHGTLTGTAPNLTYNPALNYNGPDSFTFKANDGTVDSNTATFNITVNAVNDAPVCTNGSATTNEDTPVAASLGCTDVDSPSLTYSIVSGPTNGVLSGSGASRNYSPALNYNGTDSFTFKASDGSADSNVATFDLTINAVNDAPTCSNGSATTDEDTPKAITLSCADVDGDSLTYSVVSGPSHGSVSPGTTANRTYSPALNYNGTDSFTFKASDGSADSNLATLDLTINAVNDNPTVASDSVSVTANEGDTAPNTGTVSDVDGDTVALSASVGTVTNNLDGTWSWSFDTSDGPDDSQTVTISANDGHGGTSSTTFSLTVNNVAPTVTFNAGLVQTVNEGSAQHTYGYTISDPGNDTVSSVATSCDSPHGEKVAGSDTNTNTTGSFKCTFADGPDDADLTAAATDSDNDTGATTHLPVHVNNVAPGVEFTTAPSTADEGDTKTYSYTYSDPGADTVNFASGYPSCGDHGSLVGSPTISNPGSFQCSFPEGPHTTNVAIRVTDGVDTSTDVQNVNIVEVTIANVAPTATFANNGPVDEGNAVIVSFSDQFDPSAGDTAAGFHYAYSCDGSSLASATYAGSGTSASHNCKFGDNGDFTVKGRIIDRNDGGTTYDTMVHVRNVDPTASNPSFTFDPVLGTATAGFDASDAGWLDSLANSFFKWSIDSGNRPASLSGVENNEPSATAHASDTRTLNVGCYNLTVTGVAKDDDGGQSSPLTIYSNPASVYAKGFRPPIMDNERNIVKYGNVVPVKVLLTNPCTGASVTNVSLYITTVQGAGSEVIESTNAVAESVSAADTGSQMRIADGMYIYNLATKSLTQGKDYTVRVRLGAVDGPIILAAVLQPKK
jgi:hypothetical protein